MKLKNKNISSLSNQDSKDEDVILRLHNFPTNVQDLLAYK